MKCTFSERLLVTLQPMDPVDVRSVLAQIVLCTERRTCCARGVLISVMWMLLLWNPVAKT